MDQVNIDNFIEIIVKIIGDNDPVETSTNTGIQDLFESHLQATSHNLSELKEYGINSFRIKNGDKLKISPSKWTVAFQKDKNLPFKNYHQFDYEVKSITIDYILKITGDLVDSPPLKILIELERL